MSDKLFPVKGEIWLVKFEKLKEFSKPYRPCLVVSNNTQNKFDEKIVVVPITTNDIENIEPFEVFINNILNTGLAPQEADFAAWLQDEKQMDSETLLNSGDLLELRREYLSTQQLQVNIEIPPKK